jgi:hypothetical protein
MRTEADMSGDSNPSRPDSDATFLRWQKTGPREVFALYDNALIGR